MSGSSWAPCSVSYTGNNRTHMIRIPDAGRFELRLADGAVNPYLLQAAILASGLDGIERKLNPGPRSDWNGHLPAPNGIVLRTLPTTLLDALRKLSDSQFLRQALGEEFTKSYVEVQMEQWRSYSRHLSQWELDNTLDC
jgi:glutamine synthetase